MLSALGRVIGKRLRNLVLCWCACFQKSSRPVKRCTEISVQPEFPKVPLKLRCDFKRCSREETSVLDSWLRGNRIPQASHDRHTTETPAVDDGFNRS